MVEAGYAVFIEDQRVADWTAAAYQRALQIDTSGRRHGRTWFVGVDALPNAPDGSVDGVALNGPWDDIVRDQCPAFDAWHPAQVSIVYPGYPAQDTDESDAAHGFRRNRDAAHVDGLLPEGAMKRRHLREPHAFILGLPLNAAAASPLVVWPRSHHIVRAAFVTAYADVDPASWGDVDVTDIYQAARREVFETCERVEVPVGVGESVLLDRHLVHGVAPWYGDGPDEGRIIAYFRPEVGGIADWL